MSTISLLITLGMLLAVVAALLFFRRQSNRSGQAQGNAIEAQSFARLLLLEIKLYNEQKLESAGLDGTIYQQLKPEIDQAQKQYEQRIPIALEGGRDHFYEELVNILAGGDASRLGTGYRRRGL